MLKELDAPRLRMYPPEVAIAETLHAMIVLDVRNSRMKDLVPIIISQAHIGRFRERQFFAEAPCGQHRRRLGRNY